jgi:DNA-binding NarL/FixJ family response regulator
MEADCMKKGIRQTFELDLAIKLREGSNSLLTDKESIVASYLIYDYSVNEIAQHLCRSKNTIKIHIRNMKKKCKCGTQTKFGAILQSFIKNSPQGYIQDPTSKPN